MSYRTPLILLAAFSLTGCEPVKPKPVSPAKTEALAHETELLRITLTPDAKRRLGLQTVVVGEGQTRPAIAAHGEIVLLVGNVPASVPTDPAALATNRVRADGDVSRARAELTSAQKIATRATALVKEEAGSVKASDDAQMALAVARANLQAAIEQRALLGGSPAEHGKRNNLWVRVAVFASDMPRMDKAAPALVRNLGSIGSSVSAKPVNAAPTANASAGSVDFYYAVPPGSDFHLGQRVAVDLPATGRAKGLTVPRTAILHDAYGGEWVYVQTAPNDYERRRIEVASVSTDRALLNRGLSGGDKVVVAGAAELFGTEFGSK